MKKLSLAVLTTVLLTGCTPTNGILTEKDVKDIDYKQVQEIVDKQKDIFYTPKEVTEVIERINNIKIDTEDSSEEITDKGYNIYINPNDLTYEMSGGYNSSKEDEKYFNEAIKILDETIAKGIKTYIDSHADTDIGKEGAQTAIIGRVSVCIDNYSTNRTYSYESENKDDVKNIINIMINLKDIKDKDYFNLVNSIKTKDFLLQNIKMGKYQDLIKISNSSYVQGEKGGFRKSPTQVSYDLFTKDKEIEKVRVVIMKEKGVDIENRDIVPLKNIGSVLKFDTKDFKMLEDITNSINKDTKGRKKISTDEFEYKLNNMESTNRYTDIKQSTIEVTIEKKNK